MILRRLGSVFSALSFALVVAACSSSGANEEEVTTSDEAALVAPEGLIGDQGPGWDRAEVDPTHEPSFSAARSLATPAPPPKKVLDHVWYGQETSYWCGPGSTRMAIRTRLSGSAVPSQQELATYLGTTTDGSARADVINAMNHWLTPSTPYESTPVDLVPTQEQRDLLKASVVARIAAGYPVIANVLSGWRPPGYPAGQIGHFVAVVGYDQSGDKVLIADPAGDGAAGPKWTNVPRTYWIAMQDLGRWVGGRGYSR